MYNTELNRNLSRQIYEMNKRQLQHTEDLYNDAPIGGGIVGGCGCNCMCNRCLKVNSPIVEGSGFLSDAVEAIGLGTSGGKAKAGRPKKIKLGLGETGGGETGGAKKKAGRPKKIKLGLGESGGAKGNIQDEEKKQLLKVVKTGKKTGSGIISGLLGALGLGKSGGYINSGDKLFETPQQEVNKMKSQGGAKKKENAIDNIIKAVSGKGVAGAKQYIKKGGANPRKIGGRKLLLKEEMPPSQMSGFGQPKETWKECIARVKSENPHLKGLKEVMKIASSQYKK